MSAPLGSAFWRLYAASAVSNLADGVNRVALPLLAAVERAAGAGVHTAALFTGHRSAGLRLHARAGDVEQRRERVDDALTLVHLAKPLG